MINKKVMNENQFWPPRKVNFEIPKKQCLQVFGHNFTMPWGTNIQQSALESYITADFTRHWIIYVMQRTTELWQKLCQSGLGENKPFWLWSRVAFKVSGATHEHPISLSETSHTPIALSFHMSPCALELVHWEALALLKQVCDHLIRLILYIPMQEHTFIEMLKIGPTSNFVFECFNGTLPWIEMAQRLFVRNLLLGTSLHRFYLSHPATLRPQVGNPHANRPKR